MSGRSARREVVLDLDRAEAKGSAEHEHGAPPQLAAAPPATRGVAPDLCGGPRQPVLEREASSRSFHFQLNFSRDNPGKLEDLYEVERSTLGEGSFGCARAARCRHTGSLRAVKTIPLKAVSDPRRLKLEISIARRLDHPNVVRLFEIFHGVEHIHLVMEICTGGELFDRIVSEGANGFSEGTAARYVQQMLASICYLHAHDVAHRDVKPENFLFQSSAPDAKLKIIDFGLAKEVQPEASMSTRVGTPYYVAPEVLKGSYTQKCDVWGVGVITYLLLCGYAPFSGDGDSEILRMVKKGVYKFDSPAWDLVSDMARHSVTRMLTVDPQRRASAAQALEIPWVKGCGTAGMPQPANFCDVVERLQEFREHSRMKRVALTALAQQIPDSENSRFGEIFRAMDRNGDGELSVEEVRRGLAAHGIQPPKALEEMLKSIDCNGSGQIDFTEFVAAMMDQELYTKRDLCWAAFCTFDLDGDGLISTDELVKVLSRGCHDEEKSRGRVHKMVQEVDGNGDGNIDFEEFCTMMSPKASSRARSRRTPPSVQSASWAAMQPAGASQPAHDQRLAASSGGVPCHGGSIAERPGPTKEKAAGKGWRAAGLRVRATMAIMRPGRGQRPGSQERTSSAGAGGGGSRWPWSTRLAPRRSWLVD